LGSTICKRALDDCRLRRESARIMTRTPLLITLVAAAALAGCSKNNTISNTGDNAADANVAIQLPPSVAASKIYRCADNQLIYVDWLSDNKTANVRTEQNGTPTQVVAAEPGKPMTGGTGYSLTGSATASTVTLARPDHGSQSCKA
jgi:hypothetical protein